MTLLELGQLLRKHLKFVVALPVACALVAAVVCWGFMPNTYTASVSMYVLSTSGTEAGSISNSDLSASQMLANDVATLVKSDIVQDAAAQELGMSSLSDYDISVTSATTTRIITLSVTGDSPEGVASVANALASATNGAAQQVMGLEAVRTVDQAVAPTSPSGPPRAMYTAVAFLGGFFIAVALVVLQSMIDTRIHTPEEIEELLDIPVIGRIPEVRK